MRGRRWGLAAAAALALALPQAARTSDSPWAAASQQGAGKAAPAGGSSPPTLGWGKKGKGKGVAGWAKQLRGQLPGQFDDKAAKKIFDAVGGAAHPEAKKKTPSVDDYKAKGWHYQMAAATAAKASGRGGGGGGAPGGLGGGGGSQKGVEKPGPFQWGKDHDATKPPPAGVNRSPKMDVKDPETIKKDKARYEQSIQWKEQMDAARKVRPPIPPCRQPFRRAETRGGRPRLTRRAAT